MMLNYISIGSKVTAAACKQCWVKRLKAEVKFDVRAVHWLSLSSSCAMRMPLALLVHKLKCFAKENRTEKTANRKN